MEACKAKPAPEAVRTAFEAFFTKDRELGEDVLKDMSYCFIHTKTGGKRPNRFFVEARWEYMIPYQYSPKNKEHWAQMIQEEAERADADWILELEPPRGDDGEKSVIVINSEDWEIFFGAFKRFFNERF